MSRWNLDGEGELDCPDLVSSDLRPVHAQHEGVVTGFLHVQVVDGDGHRHHRGIPISHLGARPHPEFALNPERKFVAIDIYHPNLEAMVLVIGAKRNPENGDEAHRYRLGISGKPQAVPKGSIRVQLAPFHLGVV